MQATEERARAEAAREMAESPARDAEVRKQAERAEADLNLSERDHMKVQVFLTALAHEIPTVTGRFGRHARAMITAWKKNQGLPETGFLDELQLVALWEQVTRTRCATDETKLDASQQAKKVEACLELSEQDRTKVQAALNSLGYKITTATGYFGPQTRAMITAWQKAQGLPETGCLTEAQLATLRQQAAAASATTTHD